MMKRIGLLAILACAFVLVLLTGCPGFSTRSGTAVLYGRLYNGLTRSQLTPTTNTNLSGTLTYASANATVQLTATFDAKGFYIFSGIPTNTPFVVEFSDGTTFLQFFHESNGITETVRTAGDTMVYDGGFVKLGNVYLFPADVNPGDVSIEIYDVDNGSVISASGTVLLKPLTLSSPLDNSDTTNQLVNYANDRATKISATLDAGKVTVSGTGLVLGVSYTVEVYGVAGYLVSTASTITPNTTSAQTERIALTQSTSAAPEILARSDYNAYGEQIPSGGTVTLTFDRNIELDPNTAYTAEITAITTDDTNDDTTLNVLAGFTGDANLATPVASNHLTVSVSDNVLTIAVKSGYLSTEDTADDLSIAFDRASIAVRETGSTRSFVDLTGVTWGSAAWNNATIVIRDSTVLE